MDLTTLVGLIASVCTGIYLLPQLIKLYKQRKPSDISMMMLATLFAGLVFWIWYGVREKDLIIICANSFSLLLNIWIVTVNIYFKKNASIRET